MPKMPEGVKEGIIKGMYRFNTAKIKKPVAKAQLFGSGAILNQVLEAQKLLEVNYNVAADVWSVTSYNELRREALHIERENMLNPQKPAKVPYVTSQLKGLGDVFVFASDCMKILPDGISPWVPGPQVSLGTDGFGRSESRAALRDFFEVDARHIAFATITKLFKDGKVKKDILDKATKDLDINPNKRNPMIT